MKATIDRLIINLLDISIRMLLKTKHNATPEAAKEKLAKVTNKLLKDGANAQEKKAIALRMIEDRQYVTYG